MKGDGLKGRKYSAVRLLFLFQNDEAQRQAQEKKKKGGGKPFSTNILKKTSSNFHKYKARRLLPNVPKSGRLASEHSCLVEAQELKTSKFEG